MSYGVFRLYWRRPPATRWIPTVAAGSALTLEVSDSLSFSDAPAKEAQIPKTESITVADEKALLTGKVLSDSFTLAEALANQLGKVLSDSFTLNDSFAGAIVISLAVSDSITLADSKVFQVSKVLSESLTLSDTFSRVGTFVRSFSDSLSVADSASAINPDAEVEDEPVQIRWGKYLKDRRRIARENVRNKRLQKLSRVRL
jgi:hypothetical protein